MGGKRFMKQGRICPFRMIEDAGEIIAIGAPFACSLPDHAVEKRQLKPSGFWRRDEGYAGYGHVLVGVDMQPTASKRRLEDVQRIQAGFLSAFPAVQHGSVYPEAYKILPLRRVPDHMESFFPKTAHSSERFL